MLRRWDDSQRYLSDNPSLVCEETANYLVIMCIDLEVEEVRIQKVFYRFHYVKSLQLKCEVLPCSGTISPSLFSVGSKKKDLVFLLQKHALMEQVAHQTIVMQFILELAKSLKVDPRGCFRQFFEKIKVTCWLKKNNSFKVE